MANILKSGHEAVELKLHISTLLSQAQKLTGRTQIVLDFLNAPQNVKRFAVNEFGRPTTSLFQHFTNHQPKLTASQRSAMLAKLRTTLVLQKGGQLIDKIRTGGVGVWRKAEQMAPEAAHSSVVKERSCEQEKAMVVSSYRSMLGPWAQVMAEAEPDVKPIGYGYVKGIGFGYHGGTQFGSSDLEWKAGFAALGSMMDEAARKYEMAATDEDYWALEGVWGEALMILARSVKAEYGEVKDAYEAAFASALKVAPEVFSYPNWSSSSSSSSSEEEDDM
ncbi:hypothetical protein LTR17_025560 [Elasticomyces elasticus]|nr:hypothetical protein LTR17_025560 [Elasticomyces elasticus]